MECSGIMGSDLGLTGTKKIEADKVAYTAGDTVRYSSPRHVHFRNACVVRNSNDWRDCRKRKTFNGFIGGGGHDSD